MKGNHIAFRVAVECIKKLVKMNVLAVIFKHIPVKPKKSNVYLVTLDDTLQIKEVVFVQNVQMVGQEKDVKNVTLASIEEIQKQVLLCHVLVAHLVITKVKKDSHLVSHVKMDNTIT